MGISITTLEIIFKAIELIPSLKTKKYKTLCKWCERFLKRKGFSYSIPTYIGQKTKNDSKDRLMNFLRINISIRKKYKIIDEKDLCRIVNVNETPIVFKIYQKKTIETIGNKMVIIRTFWTKKARISLILCALSNGLKLSLMIIFKGKTDGTNKKIRKTSFSNK